MKPKRTYILQFYLFFVAFNILKFPHETEITQRLCSLFFYSCYIHFSLFFDTFPKQKIFHYKNLGNEEVGDAHAKKD